MMDSLMDRLWAHGCMDNGDTVQALRNRLDILRGNYYTSRGKGVMMLSLTSGTC